MVPRLPGVWAPDVCPYEDPLFVQAFDRGEVETAEEWIHLKAIPSPQVDQETCFTCLKGEESCFAVGKVGHKAPDQSPPWQGGGTAAPEEGKEGRCQEGEEAGSSAQRGEARASSAQKGGARASSTRKGGACASSAHEGGARVSIAQEREAQEWVLGWLPSPG
ncbi:UNVERIFIED_CONTAM: hypothetical protein FKN15_035623 [Acipenser sinensis]